MDNLSNLRPSQANVFTFIADQLEDVDNLPALVRDAVLNYDFSDVDKLVWANSLSGLPTGKAIYDSLLSPLNGINLSNFSLPHIRPSRFTLLWRLLHGKFACDDMLQRIGVQLCSI